MTCSGNTAVKCSFTQGLCCCQMRVYGLDTTQHLLKISGYICPDWTTFGQSADHGKLSSQDGQLQLNSQTVKRELETKHFPASLTFKAVLYKHHVDRQPQQSPGKEQTITTLGGVKLTCAYCGLSKGAHRNSSHMIRPDIFSSSVLLSDPVTLLPNFQVGISALPSYSPIQSWPPHSQAAWEAPPVLLGDKFVLVGPTQSLQWEGG